MTQINQTVSTQLEDDIYVISVDNPPVNALSHAVREGLVAALEALAAEPAARAGVIACKGRTFFSGADISEFGKPPKFPILPEVMTAIEECPKPVVAAIHGMALGGGFETALACDARIMAPDAKLGLPEVTLGLIPGAGGAQRLPRLVGLGPALEMIVTGKPIGAAKAAEIGAIDRIAEGELLAAARDFARERAAAGKRKTSALPAPARDEEAVAAQTAYAKKRLRGQIAPLKAIEAALAACDGDFEEGSARERKLFEELRGGAQSRALRHIFFAERESRKVPGLENVSPREVARVGIIGAGTMGSGIAIACADAGLGVRLVDLSEEALARGLARIAENYRSQAAKGRISAEEAARRENAVAGATSLAPLADCDLVIEAVFEDLDVKKSVFEQLGGLARPGAILATNTSYLDVNEIARASGRPGDVLGLHFFSPAHIMKLLEIVRGAETADDALATALALARRLGKTPVVAGVCRGFIGNRMMQCYQREAGRLLLEGASPARIDAALYEFGMPMGPLAMLDLAGVDIGQAMRAKLDPSEYDFDAFRVHAKLVELGRLGQKTGAGFYAYEEGSRTPLPDPVVTDIIREIADALEIAPREIPDREIVERCIFAVVNEGAQILDDKIALRGGDIDVAYVHGYGFPRHLGGPMKYADESGLSDVLARIREFHAQSGRDWLRPAPLLERLANSGGALSTYRN